MNVAVTGAQWGDEGKGKVVDTLAARFDYVIRYQGGHNAGHSVVFDGKRFALHVLPSGVFHPETINVIANGVVVEPFSLIKEIEGLHAEGIAISPQNLKISDRAHVIMPYHGIIDRFRDSTGQRKIGTTGRGIGPAYEWKTARCGIRFCDIEDQAHLKTLIEEGLDIIQRQYRDIDELANWTVSRVLDKMAPALATLAPYVTDCVRLLAEARDEKKSLLFEGAQATLLDIDFGTYPYVTSSNSSTTGICAGAGVPTKTVDRVIGIFKAYATRVGEGPFPTEIKEGVVDVLRKVGSEFGTTTGRPRRCGWLDLVALNYAHRINGFDSLAMMKLDILDHLEEIMVCTSYSLNGSNSKDFPASLMGLSQAKPNYQTFPGWKVATTHIRDYASLPQRAKSYLAFIEDYLNCPIGLISVGPDRGQTIIRDRRFF